MNLLKSLLGSSSQMRQVTAPEAKAMIDGDSRPFILDVRQPSEFSGGHVAGAKLIPLDQLQSRMKELPTDRTILCVCRSGSRSGAAARQLASAGYDAINLRGGMIGWQMAQLPISRGK